jgi:hypothetical protein
MKVKWFVKTIIIAKPLSKYKIKKISSNQGRGISNHISSNHIYPYSPYYRYEGLSKYRRIPPISLYETLNVSHNGQGAYMGGYIKKHQTSIGIYNTYKAYEVYMV